MMTHNCFNLVRTIDAILQDLQQLVGEWVSIYAPVNVEEQAGGCLIRVPKALRVLRHWYDDLGQLSRM